MSLPTQRSSGHRARKRFGQNFLVSESVIRNILQVLNPKDGDQIIEIGPGLGALTKPLIETDANICAIELDRDLADRLNQQFGEKGNFQLLNQDVLKVDLESIFPTDARLRIIGNLPYNISTPILFHLLNHTDRIEDMLFMLQREVVERMSAEPSTSDYGRLSVMIQYRCEVESLISVPPGSFDPPPKVHSAVVRLRPRNPEPKAVSEEALDTIVRSAFGNRRKTLRNSLRNELDADSMEKLGIDPGLRPENLSVSDFVKLANCACKNDTHTR
ncbi:MAG: 16S rRNA (adenine(1518)-N(6)/adenine(1519)-N(6))-dimethyltransferase RsmA [Pseudomonadales bacterium]